MEEWAHSGLLSLKASRSHTCVKTRIVDKIAKKKHRCIPRTFSLYNVNSVVLKAQRGDADSVWWESFSLSDSKVVNVFWLRERSVQMLLSAATHLMDRFLSEPWKSEWPWKQFVHACSISFKEPRVSFTQRTPSDKQLHHCVVKETLRETRNSWRTKKNQETKGVSSKLYMVCFASECSLLLVQVRTMWTPGKQLIISLCSQLKGIKDEAEQSRDLVTCYFAVRLSSPSCSLARPLMAFIWELQLKERVWHNQ